MPQCNVSTLVYRIDVQTEINVQVEKILKNIKRAGQNRRAGVKIFSKSINVQTKIRPCRGDFLGQEVFQLYIHDWKGSLNLTEVFQSISKVFQCIPKHCQPNPKAIPKYSKVSQSIHTPIPLNVQDGIDVQGGPLSQNQ